MILHRSPLEQPAGLGSVSAVSPPDDEPVPETDDYARLRGSATRDVDVGVHDNRLQRPEPRAPAQPER